MKNKFKAKRIVVNGLILAMCGLPIVCCGKKDEDSAIVNELPADNSKESYIKIDYFLEDPGDKPCDIGEHYFYVYDTRPSNRTPGGEGSLVLNAPEGYEVYNYETLRNDYGHDTIKVTFVNTEPVYVESVKHEDRDSDLGKNYYYWDYCYPGKVIELDKEKPLIITKTNN